MTYHNALNMFFCAGASFVLIACSTTTDTTSVATTQTVTAENPLVTKTVSETASAVVSDEKICKRQKVVGSNFTKKICATIEQWEASKELSQKTTGDIQRRGSAPGVTN